jgi:hypothetical protein
MKYLKLFENFYSPANKVFKASNGPDYMKDVGLGTIPTAEFRIDDEDKAFHQGEEDFEKGITINPFIDVEHPNANLTRAWERGWKTAEKNNNI